MSNKINIYLYGITTGGNPSHFISFGCCLQSFIYGERFKTDSLTVGKKVTQYQSTMYAALMAAHLIKNDGWDIVFKSNMENIVKNINKGPNGLKYVAHNELFKSMFETLEGKAVSISAQHVSASQFVMKKIKEKVLLEGFRHAQ